jgi:hypothetical protein
MSIRDRLDVLVGEWQMEAHWLEGGRARFEWMEDGAFLVQHADAELPADSPEGLVANWPFPITTVIGLDDPSETFAYVYTDGRGVSRVYDMTLDEGEWKIWGRRKPDLLQRFLGTVSDDGQTIDGRWEQSPDGQDWELDFEIKYSKLG